MTGTVKKKIGFIPAMFFAAVLAMSGYFIFAAVQGETGHLQRMQVEAQEKRLVAELAELQIERAKLENKIYRLSDEYLDLDLLDERARLVLGLARVDEVIIR